MGGKRLIRSNRESLSGRQSREQCLFVISKKSDLPEQSNAAAESRFANFAEFSASPGDRGRRAPELAGNVADAQAAGRRPFQDDRDRDNRDPGIGRRGYEFVDREH